MVGCNHEGVQLHSSTQFTDPLFSAAVDFPEELIVNVTGPLPAGASLTSQGKVQGSPDLAPACLPS